MHISKCWPRRIAATDRLLTRTSERKQATSVNHRLEHSVPANAISKQVRSELHLTNANKQNVRVRISFRLPTITEEILLVIKTVLNDV